MEITVNITYLFKIFSWGFDYGLLKAEEERGSEEWADAFNMYLVDQKTSMPAYPIERRHLHSDKWFEAKRQSLNNFKKFISEV